MADLFDFNSWSIDERTHDQYNYFVLLGSKGMVHAYPTVSLKFPEACYSKEEALANATVASHAPRMLRTLEEVADQLGYWADEDNAIKSLREKVLNEIAVAKGEAKP